MVDELSVEVYRILVESQRSMNFAALPKSKADAMEEAELEPEADWAALLCEDDEAESEGPATRPLLARLNRRDELAETSGQPVELVVLGWSVAPCRQPRKADLSR